METRQLRLSNKNTMTENILPRSKSTDKTKSNSQKTQLIISKKIQQFKNTETRETLFYMLTHNFIKPLYILLLLYLFLYKVPLTLIWCVLYQILYFKHCHFLTRY